MLSGTSFAAPGTRVSCAISMCTVEGESGTLKRVLHDTPSRMPVCIIRGRERSVRMKSVSTPRINLRKGQEQKL